MEVALGCEWKNDARSEAEREERAGGEERGAPELGHERTN